VRISIGEPLADDASNRAFGASIIVDAEGGAIAVPEIELGKVAVKVLLAAMLIDAFHPAFEDGKEAFDGVGRYHTAIIGFADIFLLAVVDALVAGEALADIAVSVGFIRYQRAGSARWAGQYARRSAGAGRSP
jgi:hypothetical protein